MLFFTSGRAPTVRRTRHTRRFWISAASTPDPASVMQDTGAALRHARGDITEAARHAGEDFSDAARHAGDDLVDAARQVSTDASRQIRRNAAAARKEAERQVRRNAAAARATASTIPDELIPAGRDAIRKSVERMAPGRKRSRRGPLLGVLAVVACAGLALLGVQMLLERRSSLARRKGSDRSAAGMSGPTSIAKPVSTSSGTGPADGQGAPSDLTPDATTEPATFDRDAGIRAATEGMAPPESLAPGSVPSEIADRT
jgi:hypothetical protein